VTDDEQQIRKLLEERDAAHWPKLISVSFLEKPGRASLPAHVPSFDPGQVGGSVLNVGDVVYDDGGLVLDEDGVTIRHYDFPWAGSKRIRSTTIRHVVIRPMGWLTARGAAGAQRPRLLVAA
jgi:hypothetical protein